MKLKLKLRFVQNEVIFIQLDKIIHIRWNHICIYMIHYITTLHNHKKHFSVIVKVWLNSPNVDINYINFV